MKNRSDLEQELLDCWRVIDDLSMVLDSELSEAEFQAALVGIGTLYEIKFQRMWETFEGCINSGEL